MAVSPLMFNVIWITRTQPSADESAKNWQDAGFIPFVSPLLTVEPVPHDPLPKSSILIFTSKNGVDHAGPSLGRRAICVGDATAAHARRAGYKDVVSVGGVSADITAWIIQNLSQDQPLIHVSGRHIRGQISEDLSASGFKASRVITYSSAPNLIRPEKDVDMVALYSPLAADTFAKLMSGDDLSDMSAVSISPATDAVLDGLNLKARLIAEQPNELALVSAALNP